MRDRQDEREQRKRDYPTDRADRHMTFRFDRIVERDAVPAVLAETEARLVRMYELRTEAWDAHKVEEDPYEVRGALYVYEGAGAEIANLHKHLVRLRAVMGA